MTESESSFDLYQRARREHWDAVARKMNSWTGWGAAYHRRLMQIYRFLAAPGQRILEVGCGNGDLLAALRPSRGVGVDFSPTMVSRAGKLHPELEIIEADCHDFSAVRGDFDVIILSDLINDLWDVQRVFEQLGRLCHPRTRLIVNSYSRVWELPLALAEKLDVAKPKLPQNWLTVDDIANLFYLSGFEVVRSWPEILWPLATPVVGGLCNRVLARLWPFKLLAMTNFVMARPVPIQGTTEPLVSVIIPARNEVGNIDLLFTRVPEMGSGTELVFVEGGSTDGTDSAIEGAMALHPGRKCQFHRQTGSGKGDAVRLGFFHARGDVLMILDADMTVAPEDLPRFYDALQMGRGDFINGVRLVYPMEEEAMRLLNFFGNKFFSLAFSWLLGQPVKDTLCGTKVLWRRDYEMIAANRSYFGDFDPFGDFDLIFGAARLGLRIVDMPVRYLARAYGSTNIERWRHGFLLLRMAAFAARRIKFV